MNTEKINELNSNALIFKIVSNTSFDGRTLIRYDLIFDSEFNLLLSHPLSEQVISEEIFVFLTMLHESDMVKSFRIKNLNDTEIDLNNFHYPETADFLEKCTNKKTF